MLSTNVLPFVALKAFLSFYLKLNWRNNNNNSMVSAVTLLQIYKKEQSMKTSRSREILTWLTFSSRMSIADDKPKFSK